MVGPIQLTFMYCAPRGSPAAHISSPRMKCSHTVLARPPYSFGQCGTSRPAAASFGQNSREKAVTCGDPGPWREISFQFGGNSRERKSRIVWRNALSSVDHVNSIEISDGKSLSHNTGYLF